MSRYCGTDLARRLTYEYSGDTSPYAELEALGLQFAFCHVDGRLLLTYMFFEKTPGDGQDGAPVFPCRLPRGLERHRTEAEVVQALGVPDARGGNFRHDELGYQPPWIKYYLTPKIQLMIELRDADIWRVSIGRAFGNEALIIH